MEFEADGNFAAPASDAAYTFDGQQADFGGQEEESDAFAAAAAPAPQPSVSAAAAAAPTASSSSGGGANPLALFNAKFRAACEEKDAKERDAKAARRAAGKVALKGLLADRGALVDARKAKNREDEAGKEREAMDALEGESWGRVVSLIDVHGVHAAAAPAASDKKKASDAPEPDMGRQKDLLIALKSAPLPAAAN